jgi:hypothetical protein
MRRESESDRTVATLLRKQGGLITRPQVLAAGWSEGTLRHRTRSDGPWLAVLPGIYLGSNGPIADGQREIAAVLYGGPGCVLTGPASLRQQGVRIPATDMIDVLIQAPAKRQSTGFVRTHRTTRMPDQTFALNGIRWTLAARAVADTIRGEHDVRTVRTLVASAVQGGQCTVPQLAQELKTAPTRESGQLRMVLEEVADGMASAAEADLRQLIKRSGLPEPMYNPDLYVGSEFLARPDAYWKDAGVAAEVDSRAWHLGPEQWTRTVTRHDRMTAHGIYVLHFIPKQFKTEGRRVIAELRSTIENGRQRPLLPIRVEPHK